MTGLSRWMGPMCLALTLVAFGRPAAASGDAGELAGELARLRADVERLSSDIERSKDEARSRLRTLTAQKADLELEHQREALRIEHTTAAISAREARIEAAAAAQAALAPVARELIAGLRAWVERALPYRRAERLAAVAELAERLERGELTPALGIARWWEQVEDELRLSRESALDRQVVTVDGQARLVDVIHLGLVGLVYRASAEGPGDDPRQSTYGLAVREGEGWGWRRFEGVTETQQLATLFDTFDKRIRVGFFVLPAVLFGGTSGGRP